ncbi:MAG: hypothetical protein CME45_01370 [Halieaceae bacterium]|nr:hypothetical protein [Halieaceae bacterium]|tara:strand:+ start:8403 stop:8741 length:339 start_codon:yes stop_codon:yes gene_type:complete
MLTTQSYLIAILLYWASAIGGVWLLKRLWLPVNPGRGAAAMLGCLAGLLLAPAFPGESTETVAPALIIVIFNTVFGEGVTSAVWPGVWLVGSAIAGTAVSLWWRRRGLTDVR